jgi:hypothetical protein
VVCYPIVNGDLIQITLCKGGAIHSAQLQEAMNQAFRVAHGYGRGNRFVLEQYRTNQYPWDLLERDLSHGETSPKLTKPFQTVAGIRQPRW